MGWLPVSLTDGACLYILDDIFLHVKPPVVLSYVALSVACSQIPAVWCSMHLIQYSLLEVEMFWHTDSSAPHPDVVNLGEVFSVMLLFKPGI